MERKHPYRKTASIIWTILESLSRLMNAGLAGPSSFSRRPWSITGRWPAAENDEVISRPFFSRQSPSWACTYHQWGHTRRSCIPGTELLTVRARIWCWWSCTEGIWRPWSRSLVTEPISSVCEVSPPLPDLRSIDRCPLFFFSEYIK